MEPQGQTDRRVIVRAAVRDLLARSAAFERLPPEERREVAASTETVAKAITDDPEISAVDFPAFVSDLIEGTFDAIVDASIRQMEAYGELVKSVAATVDEFARSVPDEAALGYLEDVGIDPGADPWPDAVRCLLVPAARRRRAAERRRLLATVVRLGVHRAVGDSDARGD